MKPSSKKESGLPYWMKRALTEHRKAGKSPSPEVIHDLRVALRRCRSLAEGLRLIKFDSIPAPTAPGRQTSENVKFSDAAAEIEPEARWLFKRLARLRETQVMLEWVKELYAVKDPAFSRLQRNLWTREEKHLRKIRKVLRKWKARSWERNLRKVRRLNMSSPESRREFLRLAVRRLRAVRKCHTGAMKHPTDENLHDLRIHAKKFRYTLENFLPDYNAAWGKDLKGLQDLLGDYHDLHELRLWLEESEELDKKTLRKWQGKISAERGKRLRKYRKLTRGAGSLWSRIQSGLIIP